MPYDSPSTPVLEDSFRADISAGERVTKKWSLIRPVSPFPLRAVEDMPLIVLRTKH